LAVISPRDVGRGTPRSRPNSLNVPDYIPGLHPVDAATGKTLLQTPYTAVRWLADQRLLAVGPLENAPATRGIVAVPAPKVKIDPPDGQ
jgi:hypothetical protein